MNLVGDDDVPEASSSLNFHTNNMLADAALDGGAGCTAAG
jgi:hypothetical protein